MKEPLLNFMNNLIPIQNQVRIRLKQHIDEESVHTILTSHIPTIDGKLKCITEFCMILRFTSHVKGSCAT